MRSGRYDEKTNAENIAWLNDPENTKRPKKAGDERNLPAAKLKLHFFVVSFFHRHQTVGLLM